MDVHRRLLSLWLLSLWLKLASTVPDWSCDMRRTRTASCCTVSPTCKSTFSETHGHISLSGGQRFSVFGVEIPLRRP